MKGRGSFPHPLPSSRQPIPLLPILAFLWNPPPFSFYPNSKFLPSGIISRQNPLDCPPCAHLPLLLTADSDLLTKKINHVVLLLKIREQFPAALRDDPNQRL